MSASLTSEKYLWRYGRFLSLTRFLMLIGYYRKTKSGIICVREGSLKRTEIYYQSWYPWNRDRTFFVDFLLILVIDLLLLCVNRNKLQNVYQLYRTELNWCKRFGDWKKNLSFHCPYGCNTCLFIRSTSLIEWQRLRNVQKWEKPVQWV